eukprot:gene15128-biopygen6248
MHDGTILTSNAIHSDAPHGAHDDAQHPVPISPSLQLAGHGPANPSACESPGSRPFPAVADSTPDAATLPLLQSGVS